MASKLAHDRFRKCRPEKSHSIYGVPRFLNLNRKVFLSHSGGDKDFVWFLHEQLCNRYHDAIAFFDDVTLPKAEPVSMKNILQEAKGSELGVLVLSEDFFMRTPNPMRELVEFTTSGVRLLPLFFKISVAEFKDKSRRARWQKQWKKWAAGDKGVINAWKHALDFVNTFAGLEYHKVATNHCNYIHEIVKVVTRIIRPAILFSEEGVYGKDRLCEIVEGLYNRCTLEHTSNDGAQVASASTSSHGREDSHYVVDVVGVYGFAGLGKTTLCKCLCDNYFQEFNGKVCHIDLGSRLFDQASPQTHSPKAFFRRMEYILAMLTDYINDGQRLQFSQVKYLLTEQFSSMTDPVFLAIDNILPEREIQMEAGFYLSLKFPKGSKVFLTSRSDDILENLASQFSSFSVVIKHIPGLELQEARDIFVHEIPEVRDPGILNIHDEVNDVVKMCRIHLQRDLGGYQRTSAEYHPLMLKSLAASIKWKRTRNLDWKGRLAKLRSEGIVNKNDAWKTVFNVLDISYALLREEAETLFLDLLLFYSATQNPYKIQDWVESVYSHLREETIEEIFLQLHDLFFIRERSEPPDLLVCFAKYKASQNKRTGIDPHYLVMDGEPCPENILGHIGHVRHVNISRCVKARTLDLRNVQGLEVLHLVDNAGLQEVLLSRTTCASLRSVIVRVPPRISLYLTMDEDLSVSATDQQHSMAVGPQWAQLEGNVILPTPRRRSSSWWAQLGGNVLSTLLRRVEITAAPVMDLGCLGSLLNLEHLGLYDLPSVQAIDVTTCARLKYLDIMRCKGLLALTIPNSRLESYIDSCSSLERVSLCTTSSYPESDCSSHGSIYLEHCQTLGKIDGFHQYAGKFRCRECDAANLEELFGDLLKSGGIGSSTWKAKVRTLELSGLSPGFAGAATIHVEDAQHIWLLLAPLFEAQPECCLSDLSICCKKGGGCGCDRISPSFVPLTVDEHPRLTYCCPQVRDLSSVARWDVLKELNLSGCTSVEVWPDFATMTSLRYLDLSYTLLKEWPAGVLPLRGLLELDLRGCRQLPAEELIRVIALEQDIELFTCRECALGTLLLDLEAGVRERWSVMDALDSHFHEIWQRGGLESWHRNEQVLVCIIMLLYDFWFNEGCGAASDCREGSPSVTAVQKMRRLLCGAFVMQLFPVYLGSRVEKGFKDPFMAYALMGIAVVGAASIGWYNAAVNECLKDSIISFLKACSSQGEGSSATMLQQDHLYFHLWWPRNRRFGRPQFFRPLSWRPDPLGARVPKLRERVGEGVQKMMARAADQVGPEFIIQGLEATSPSINFLQYDVGWLLGTFIQNFLLYDPFFKRVLREYYNLMGEDAFQTVCRSAFRETASGQQPLCPPANIGPVTLLRPHHVIWRAVMAQKLPRYPLNYFSGLFSLPKRLP